MVRNILALLSAASLVVLSGCAAQAEYVRMSPPADIEDGVYAINLDSKDRCSGPVRSYDFMVTVKDGKMVGEPKMIGNAANTGTCQQIMVGVAKSLVPSLVEFKVGMDRNDAIRDASENHANAVKASAAAGLAATQYAVDNTEPAQIMQVEDNRTFVNTDTNVGVDVTNNGDAPCCPQLQFGD